LTASLAGEVAAWRDGRPGGADAAQQCNKYAIAGAEDAAGIGLRAVRENLTERSEVPVSDLREPVRALVVKPERAVADARTGEIAHVGRPG